MKLELSDNEIEFLIRVLTSNHAEKDSDFESNIISGGISSLLIGKLVAISGSKGYNYFNSARDNRYEKTPVNEKLFMGSGWHSIVACNKLHKRLCYAFGQLSGLEQNGGMGYPFDEEMDKKFNQDIKDVLKDLLFAFDLTPDDLK